ncbi:ferrochelatase [Novipirellula artificiosorum]|nr:ferrochelatase [Novipirellula artificiosorum]
MSDREVPYDSFLLVSFGGPEGPDDVIPFLENVLRGKPVPRERMLEVAEHYQQFGGVSPINEQNRQLLAAIQADFEANEIHLPVYWGNRNWGPYFAETLQQMRKDGCKRALAFFTSMYSCNSGCRQYREDIAAAQAEVGEGCPSVDKVRMGFNHPLFIETMADNVQAAADSIEVELTTTHVLFTAHSIPMAMAENSDYEKQLKETCRLVAERSGADQWSLVYQSRSGPPQQPWLEPDVCDAIAAMDDESHIDALIIVPVGFISDHMEVLFDLDHEAADVCKHRGIKMARAATVGTASKFVTMIRELVQERTMPAPQRLALGNLGPWHDVCPADCCLYTPKRPAHSS